MTNGGKPTLMSLDKKVAVLENDFQHFCQEVGGNIKDIKEPVEMMNRAWLELTRRVKESHEFKNEYKPRIENAEKFIKSLENAECPAKKVMPPADGEEPKRREEDKPKYKYARYALYVSIVGLIISNIGSCAYVMTKIGEVLEKIPQ